MAHILVVDDEHDVVTLIKFLLENEGHRVSSANDGAEALKFLGIEPESEPAPEDRPNMIILDVMMPVVDGHAVARKLAAHDRLRAVPLIVLSAKGQVKALFEASGNVAAYMEKPFDPKKLKELVAGILKG